MANINPQLLNFTIEDGQPSRVYFESTKIITAGVNGIDGFKIEGKTISGVSINSGALTGHYFTLSANITYWDVVLIRYEGNIDATPSDIKDSNNNLLFDFTLQFITNNINEPTASNLKYVEVIGGGDGSIGNPWSISQAGSAVAGETVWIKTGDYGTQKLVVSNDGAIDNPIKFIGYKDVAEEGNASLLTRSIGMTFLSSDMPLFEGTGSLLKSTKDYIIIKNIQAKNTSTLGECFSLDRSTSNVLYNCYSEGGKYGMWQYSGERTGEDLEGNTQLIRCYAANASNSNIRIRNYQNLVYDTWSVSSYTNSNTDYYINIYGGNIGHSNAIIGCYVDRIAGNTHTGHGLSLKSGIDSSGDQLPTGTLHYSLMENNIIYRCRGSIEYRHSETRYCVGRGNTIIGTDDINNTKGLKFQNGTRDNIEENSSIIDSDSGIFFKYAYDEDISAPVTGDNNIVRNCIFDNCNEIIGITDEKAINNKFYNNTFNNGNNFSTSDGNTIDLSNIGINNIVSNCGTRASQEDIQFSYSNSFNNSFGNFVGGGNISIDPQFSPFPTVTNPALQVGLWINGNEYDASGEQRSAPPTIGSVEIVGATSPISVKLTWTNSITSGVTKTIIYRDDVKIGEVLVASPSEFLDTTPVLGNTYKYEVQALNQNGESVVENTGAGGNVVILSLGAPAKMTIISISEPTN